MDQSTERREPQDSRSIVNDLVCGLRKSGMTVADMALASQDPVVLDAMARAALKILRRGPGEVVRISDFRKFESEAARLKAEPHRLMRICGTTRHSDRKFSELMPGVVVEPSARALLEQNEVCGSDEANLYTFRVIPIAPFYERLRTPDEIMEHVKICKVLRAVYPKFDQSRIDASLIVGMVKERQRLIAIAEEQKVAWFLLLHKTVRDLANEEQVLEIRIMERRKLRLRAIRVKDDTIWSTDGALLVLSH